MSTCKTCTGPSTTDPDSCGTQTGTMEVCYPKNQPSPPWQGGVEGCCKPVPSTWNKKFGDYLSHSLQQASGGRQRLTPEQADCTVWGVSHREQTPRDVITDEGQNKQKLSQILVDTGACCTNNPRCDPNTLKGRQPGSQAYAKPSWAGPCASTKFGCCADGKAYANSQNDSCKKRAHKTLIIIVIVLAALVVTGFGIWAAVILLRRHP